MLTVSRFNLLAFALSGLASACLGFWAFSEAELPWIVQRSSYWVLLAAVVAFVLSIFRLVRMPGSRVAIRGFARPWLLVYLFLVSAGFLLLQPAGFKVVMDEPVLVATSHQLHAEKEMFTPTRCYRLGGVFYSLDGYVDKRPGLYPFLMSLMHDATGYRSNQGIWLNALLTPLFVGLLAWAGQLLNPRWGSWLAPLLALTVPLIAINTNGSGFELLNLCLILGSFILAVHYLSGPSSERLDALFFAAVLLAHTRYESAIYVIPVGLIALLGFRKAGAVHLSIQSAVVPLLLIPIAHLYRMIRSNPEHMQIREGDTRAFALGYLGDNVESAGRFFFDFSSTQPNSWLLSLCAVVAAVALAVRLGGRLLRRQGSVNPGLLIPALAWTATVLMTFGLVLGYHWGQLDDFAATRLALPMIVVQVLLVVAATALCGRTDLWAKGLLGITALYFVGVTRPTCASTDFLTQYLPTRSAHWLQARVLERKGENALFIAQQRLIPVVERMSGISIGDALAAKAELNFHLGLRTFNGVYLVYLRQSEFDDISAMEEAISVSDHFEMSEVETFRLNPYREIVLARVEGIKFEKGEAQVPDLRAYEGIEDPSEWLPLVRTTLP